MLATRLWQNTSKVHFDATQREDGRRLIYGGHVISLARALSFNGLANAQIVAGINAGAHANPCFAGDTVGAWSEVLGQGRDRGARGGGAAPAHRGGEGRRGGVRAPGRRGEVPAGGAAGSGLLGAGAAVTAGPVLAGTTGGPGDGGQGRLAFGDGLVALPYDRPSASRRNFLRAGEARQAWQT